MFSINHISYCIPIKCEPYAGWQLTNLSIIIRKTIGVYRLCN